MSVRVVSLVPSSTETLLALGADVIACTRFCEQPDLRHVGGTKNPDIDAIIELRPDVVVMDREENRIEDHDALVAAGCARCSSATFDPSTTRSRWSAIWRRSTDAPDDTYERCLAPDVTSCVVWRARRTAFVPIWRRPWMSIGAGTYGASLLDLLGIDLVTADAADPYPTVELERDRGVRLRISCSSRASRTCSPTTTSTNSPRRSRARRSSGSTARTCSGGVRRGRRARSNGCRPSLRARCGTGLRAGGRRRWRRRPSRR